MSTSTHPFIVPSDYDIEDAFSSTNTPDYTPASPDYFPASPGNTFSDPLDDLSNNESLIPPQAPIAPPTVLPSPPVLSLSPMFDPQDFFLPEEILPSRKRARSRSSFSTSALPQHMEDKIEGLGNARVIIQRDFDKLDTELQKARTQITRLQREQMGHNDEIVLARVRISTLEMIIKDIQVLHQADMKSLLDKIRELKNHKGGLPGY
nr:hypothetical protein [Tanacetum cinerariifolium]